MNEREELAIKGEVKTEEIAVTVSSGNVFEDLGLPNPEERLAKSDLALKITTIIEKGHLSQVEAAEILGIPQPKVSKILNGKLKGFSLEKLCEFLTLLGRDIEIVIKPKRKEGRGRLTVTQL